MAEFIVSARKYRPDTFKNVVGQESITTTLKNSIITQHLAQAYLFCGPRGVGKTTCARIFAKTINCFHPNSDAESCNECDSCKGFNKSSSFNIRELDAASNNSVEGMRNLIDQVRVPPQLGKYNVYIIDEVHMLSNHAFNTFLKTLEEPPAHAIFILATTEKQKIIPTILSRCQIFDFNRINVNDIVGHLQFVAGKENVKAEPEALNIIAQKSDGAMRDALSIFDQIVSFCGTEITYDKVIENLNVLDYDYYFKLTENFISGNIPQSLILFNEILSKGFEAQFFITGLASHFRDLLVCKDPITIQLLEVGKAIAERYKFQANQVSADFLIKALNISNQCDIDYRNSHNKRLYVELSLVKICNLYGQSATNDTATASSSVNQPKTVSEIAKTETLVNKPDVPTIIPAAVPVKEEKDENKSKIYSKPKSFRIKDALKGNTPDKEETSDNVSEPDVKVILNKPFTSEDLTKAWLKFAATKSNKIRISQLLQTNIPKIINNKIIEIPAVNKSQEDELHKLHDELLVFLKQTLQNTEISITIVLSEQRADNKTKPYTDIEKFQFLVKKNPNLQKLKDRLDLDFDH